MKTSSSIIAFSLIVLPLSNIVIEASLFGRQPDIVHNSLTSRESSYCGPHHMPCGSSEPCCNNGTCHTTSMSACPISQGCDPWHSYFDACFPLPGCRNAKWEFEDPKILIPKAEFTGDPEQASWVSEFSHIAPYAEIDPHEKKLLLRVRRDLVRTQNGGGFGATVSTTRWHKYGAFTVKLRSGSTGPGIITAFLLTNPTLGEQISFEFIGKDPKSVTTNFYRRVPAINTISSTKPPINMIPVDSSQPPSSFSPSYRLESHEKVHRLRHDTTKHDLVYKIEWTSEKISWSVGNKILRVVTSTDIDAIGGLPRDAMQLQLTIWDAGHSPETIEWAGGKAFYGPNNLDEYIAEISTVKIDCQNPTDSSDPWPGHDALSRLHSQDIKANISPRGRHVKAANSTKSFFRISILSIIKWICVMLSLIFGAAYFTEPKPRVSRRRTMDPLRASRPL